MKVLYLLIIVILAPSCTNWGTRAYDKHIWEYRSEYVQGFLEEEESPLTADDLDQLSFFKPDSHYRVFATFSFTFDAAPFEINTSSGMTKPYRSFAKLNFELKGKACELTVYESLRLKDKPEYKDYLFLPFTDHTNGESTYGGGRYLDLNRQAFQSDSIRVEIDFNKAYNPWCAYSDGYHCPVPPPENALDLPVFAGERNYLGTYKHRKI